MPFFLCCALWKVNAISARLERVEFECLGCWPCRTTVVALISLVMHFKSRIRTQQNWLESEAVWRACISNCFALKNCMTYASGHAEHRRFKRSADLKQDFFHLVAGTFFRREMTHVKQSDRLCKMCCEFMVLRCAVLCLGWSWVEDKQSSEWWKPEHV